jgi:hypothetical protein
MGKAGPDPSGGVKLDLEILERLTTEQFGRGPVLNAVRRAQVGLERGDVERAQLSTHTVLLMIAGAMNVVAQSYRVATPSEPLEEALTPWRALEERAGLCVHNLDKLPEELRIWKAARESGG